MTCAVVTIPELETDRLVMRCPAEADIEPLAAFHATDRAAFVGGAMSRIDCWKQLTSAIGHWHFRGWGRWTCVERQSGKAAGLVGLHAPEGWPEPEIAWTIFGGFEGKGLAHEAARAARRYAYEVAGWTTAISLIDPANARSAALARRLEATKEGRFDHETYGTMDIWRHPAPDAGA